MRQRIALFLGFVALTSVGGIATYSITRGQLPAPTPPQESVKPAVYKPAPGTPTAGVVKASAAAPRDLSTMSEQSRKLYLSARSGAEWLLRAENAVSGRFLPGWLPALNIVLEHDDYLHQAGATYALAKAARYFGDERYLMKARQAILSLLAETTVDPAEPGCRYTSLPPISVNRLAAAGMLLLVIHELQSPDEELLKQGEELCQYIRKQQQSDGTFRLSDSGIDVVAESEAARTYPAMAIYGLMVSQRNRPAPWKLEAAARAFKPYRDQWKLRPSLSGAAWLTLAFSECYLQTKNEACAQFVFEMSDWVCALQYGPDARSQKWTGGFMSHAGGKPVSTAPSVESAVNLEALALACLVTRHVPDAQRFSKYREAVNSGAHFLTSLQFNGDNTTHFSPAYRTALLGGYHATHADGNLRIDYNHHAVVAVIQYATAAGLP